MKMRNEKWRMMILIPHFSFQFYFSPGLEVKSETDTPHAVFVIIVLVTVRA